MCTLFSHLPCFYLSCLFAFWVLNLLSFISFNIQYTVGIDITDNFKIANVIQEIVNAVALLSTQPTFASLSIIHRQSSFHCAFIVGNTCGKTEVRICLEDCMSFSALTFPCFLCSHVIVSLCVNARPVLLG